ncbi:myosin heavy chain, skeletal muscle, adult isoform X2 [Drosophila busckii]|nr:myosin heavy chain, skeletal muscle, adult isoform X2 [Drosophila busckii]
MLLTCSTSSYRLVKRHHFKMPQNIYADFAAISVTPLKVAAHVAAPLCSDCSLTAASAVQPSGGAGCSKEKCDVKQIFSPGSPKQKTSSIAAKAAMDAKAANEAQAVAGQLAAQHVKQELAEKAFQSAKQAEAALSGKQMVVEQLEVEVNEANAVVEEETSSLQGTETNMNSAVEAARTATQQYETLNELHRTVKENLVNIQAVAMGTQQEVSEKVTLLEAAKNRLDSLQKQLQVARDDYEKTKSAAYKAACAAVEAKQKAQNSHIASRRRRYQRRQRRRPA